MRPLLLPLTLALFVVIDFNSSVDQLGLFLKCSALASWMLGTYHRLFLHELNTEECKSLRLVQTVGSDV